LLGDARTRQERIDALQHELTTPPVDPNKDPLETSAYQRAELNRKYGNAIFQATTGSSGGTSATTTLDQATICKSSPVDSDNDGLCDAFERIIGTNPMVADTDGDGLNDGIEVLQIGTNPTDIDTDSDGISDGVEVRGYTGIDG